MSFLLATRVIGYFLDDDNEGSISIWSVVPGRVAAGERKVSALGGQGSSSSRSMVLDRIALEESN
jgi:hypothetical protein